MSGLTHAKNFRDLIVYQKARAAAQEIFELTSRFPRDEKFSLVDQMRRSSRSVGAQIAEAWAKRRYEARFISKLTDADGEQMETQHWLETALDCKYLSKEEADAFLEKYAELGRLLGGMMAKAELFCNPEALSVREEQAPYFANPDDCEVPEGGTLLTEH
ncbi:MAG: four helix bundle protein [Chloroflexota bacterium]